MLEDNTNKLFSLYQYKYLIIKCYTNDIDIYLF